MMWKTSISHLIFATTLISATSLPVTHRDEEAVVTADVSSTPKRDARFEILGEGMKSDRNDFARILFENYKRLTASVEDTMDESLIRGIKANELPRRKLDTGNPILTENPPTVLNLFPTHKQNGESLKNKTAESEESGGQGSKGDRAKGPRVHYGEASSNPATQGPAHAQAQESHGTGLVFPDSINEVISPHFGHPVHHHDHHYPQLHQPQYYGHHTPKHVGIHEHLPHSVHHYNEHSGLAHAVSKSLKFWIPTALLLTGASVLFPQRIKVPTNLEDIQNNRPKRSTYYQFTAGDKSDDEGKRFEKILPSVLRREHRTEVTNGKGDDESLQISPSQYYEPHESQRVASAPPGAQQQRRKQVPQNGPKTNDTQRRVVWSKRTQKAQQHEQRQIFPTRFDEGYDAFEYQKEETQIGGETGSGENVASYAPAPTVSSITSTSTTQTAQTSSSNPKHGRKLRVLLRSRQNGTAVTPTPSAPQDAFTESKIRPENKSPQKVKVQPTKQTTVTVKDVTQVAPTVASLISKSPPAAGNPSPTVTNATKAPKSLQAHLFEREPDLLQLLSESIQSQTVTKLSPSPSKGSLNSNSNPEKLYDLSPEGPVVGLLSSVIEHENDSEACQKRALCELAIKGTNPNATRFETFMWTVATLVPDAFTTFYDLEDTFAAIREKQCGRYICANPNLDIQE